MRSLICHLQSGRYLLSSSTVGSIIYTKPGETVRGSFSIGEEYINAEGDESLQSVAVELIDPSGKVVQTLNFNGTEAIGTTKSFTDQPVSTAGVWSVRYTSGRGADPGYFGLLARIVAQ